MKITKLSDLKLDKKNANKGTSRGRKLLKQSLEELGIGRSILVDRSGNVIAGNKTAETLQSLKQKKIRVIQTSGDELVVVQRTDLDIDSKKARKLAVADNRVAELDLDWNAEVLGSLDLDLGDYFNDAELRKLLGPQPGDEGPAAQIDKAAELQAKWNIERGQIWEIGRHRLMCGDSGDPKDVTRLMAGKRAWMMATDPPYGVGYGQESGPDSAKRFDAMNGDGNDGPVLQEFLEKVFHAAIDCLESGAVWYLWHAQMTQGFFTAAAAAAQFRIHRQIIWSKSHFILGHGDFHWQHELCFYGWREKEKHRWFGGRDQSTVWQIDNPRAHENHPTEKPPEIFARSMRLSTEEGDLCFEPFSGSGSQLVAAEQSKRICYAMEIEPKYVAVALERMADMGLKPKLAKRSGKA